MSRTRVGGEPLDFLRVIREPGGRARRVVPNQRMALAGDAVLAGPGRHLVRVFVVRFARSRS